jgi:hypothetical protein
VVIFTATARVSTAWPALVHSIFDLCFLEVTFGARIELASVRARKEFPMNWKLWLKGLAAAAIGGAASGATQALSSNATINAGTGMTAAAGALVTMLAYLAKSPLAGQPAPPAQQ